MQSIGLIGEILLKNCLPSGHILLNLSLTRFILFDGVGLVLLIIGYLFIPGENQIKDQVL
jgi:hypothetical protein